MNVEPIQLAQLQPASQSDYASPASSPVFGVGIVLLLVSAVVSGIVCVLLLEYWYH